MGPPARTYVHGRPMDGTHFANLQHHHRLVTGRVGFDAFVSCIRKRVYCDIAGSIFRQC